MKSALTALSALAHETRLEIFRTLVKAGEVGLPAGELSQIIGVQANTLSNNLTILARAGLVRSVREGRSIRYFCEIPAMADLVSFLLEDCCGGNTEACAPAIASILSPK